MFCQKCGTKNPENSQFCLQCGMALEENVVFRPKRKGLGTGAIIGIVVASVLAGIVWMGVIFYAIGAVINEEKENAIQDFSQDGTVYLKLDETKMSFKLPSGYHAAMDNTIDYKEYDNEDGDYLIYYLDYAYDDYYTNQKKYIKKLYDTRYSDNHVINEYVTEINGKNTKAFYLDYKEGFYTYRVTYVFYPVNDDYYAIALLGIEGVTKENLTNYIQTDKRYI